MSQRIAKVLVTLRFVLVPLWVAGVVLAVVYLPSIQQAQAGAIGALLPKDVPAVQAETLSKKQFPFPLITRTVAVRHDADGLSPRALREAAETARAVREGRIDIPGLAAVVPVPNTALEQEARPTTILYYLYFRSEVDSPRTYDLAQRFARQHIAPQAGGVVGVTGTVPAEETRTKIIYDHLFVVTAATAALVAFAVGLYLRSPLAPVVNLLTVGTAVLVASRVLGWAGVKFGIAVPREVEPVVVVLLFGAVTDYTIFFLSRFRHRLGEGHSDREAAQRATADVVGIVLAAGLVIALATTSLLVAQLSFFQVFGPAMAVAVLIGMLVAVTFVPGVMALAGRFVLWPQARPDRGRRDTGDPQRLAVPIVRPGMGRRFATWPRTSRTHTQGEEPDEEDGRSLRARVARLTVRRPLAVAIACILLLGAAAIGLLRYELANPAIQSLPADAAPQRAYSAASAGFPTDGAVAPAIAVVREPGLAAKPERLRELGRLLAGQPGVATVFGPGDVPDGVEGLDTNAFVAGNGDLARYLIIPKSDPLDERAVDTLRRLQDHAPDLLKEVGLGDAELLFGGDPAIAASLVERTFQDLFRVAPVALAATFLGLALFLRSLVAPLYLLVASVLALLAALGTSAYLYEPLFDPSAIAFFVPFAVSILLLALGSDYNVFITGRIWDEARKRPLREAVEVAGTRAARPIATAGLVLAGSFALLALVPLTTFRVVALTMAVGLLLDAFVVRQLLVPALVVLVGRRSGWPGRRLGQRPEERKGARPGNEEAG